MNCGVGNALFYGDMNRPTSGGQFKYGAVQWALQDKLTRAFVYSLFWRTSAASFDYGIEPIVQIQMARL